MGLIKPNKNENSAGGGGTKILVPSSGRVLHIDTNSYESRQFKKNIFVFTPKYDGVLEICAEGNSGHSNYRAYVAINDSEVLGFGQTQSTASSYFSVTKNTQYTVSVYNSDSTSRYFGMITNIRFCGEVISSNTAFNEF